VFKLLEGYTEPKTISVPHHVSGEKWPEMVHAQYQDISLEVLKTIHDILVEMDASPDLVRKIRLIIGGDHGVGAFRLCFCVVINLEGHKKPVHKTKSIAEVYSKREEGIILEETIMPWLTEDLKKINDSFITIKAADPIGCDDKGVLIYDDKGSVVCDYRLKASLSGATTNTTTDTGCEISTEIEQFVAGDFCFFAYILGREGSSLAYCPYCPLQKKQWQLEGHAKGQPLTREFLTGLHND
jgi:hypothetical protein